MTIKAIRATMQVGSIELDVFQMPDGGYSYGVEFLATLIERDKTILSNKKSPYYLQTLLGGDKTSQTVKIDDIGYAYKAISQAQMGKVLGALARLGHGSALAILEATFEESLERRADAAFGVQRSEQERNERLSARTQGKVARRYLTDSIADYLEANPDLSDNYRKFIWSNCSDHLNKIILGAKAKQAKEFLEVPKNSLLRNHIPIAALNELERVEDLASRIIDEKGTEPLEAVKQAAILMFTKTIGLI